MLIQINENYRLTSDKYNVTLEERTVNKKMLKADKDDKKATIPGENYGKETWSPIGYYPTVEQALNNYFSKKIRMVTDEGIQTLLYAINEVRADIQNLKIAYEHESRTEEGD